VLPSAGVVSVMNNRAFEHAREGSAFHLGDARRQQAVRPLELAYEAVARGPHAPQLYPLPERDRPADHRQQAREGEHALGDGARRGNELERVDGTAPLDCTLAKASWHRRFLLAKNVNVCANHLQLHCGRQPNSRRLVVTPPSASAPQHAPSRAICKFDDAARCNVSASSTDVPATSRCCRRGRQLTGRRQGRAAPRRHCRATSPTNT
jgi:hypothetical protein